MGTIIQARDFSLEKQARLLKPIIFCCPYSNVESEAISVNLLLAEELVRLRPNRRTLRLEHSFGKVLNTLPDDVMIKDFDVLFNPEYQVDLLKLMVIACKKKPFSMIWPGICDDGMLSYAEEGYKDYKLYRIEDYDVTCIV